MAMEKALSIDRIRDATFKDLNIGHLVSLDQVSHGFRSAVRSYKYAKVVEVVDNSLPPNILKTDKNDIVLRGPVISKASAGCGWIDVIPWKKYPEYWAGELRALNAMAANLESVDISCEPCQMNMPEKIMKEMIDTSINMATFPKCTKLDLHMSYREDAFAVITPKILKFFPSLKILNLYTSIVPPLCYLPHPELLEELTIYTKLPNRKTTWYTKTPKREGPKVVNFDKLTSFVLKLDAPENFSGAGVSFCKNLFGIKWEESLAQFPPPLECLVVKTYPKPISGISHWTVDLMKSCASTLECLKLDLTFNIKVANAFEDCLHALPDKTLQLPRLKSLCLIYFDESMVCSFLNIIKMPVLENLTVLFECNALGSFKVVVEEIESTVVYPLLKELYVKGGRGYKPKLADLKKGVMPALNKYTYAEFSAWEQDEHDNAAMF